MKESKMSQPAEARPPSPTLFFETVNAYQRTEALKAAIQLDVFTAIGAGATTAGELARQCDASQRGVRTLCDYLVVIGFLTKEEDRYHLTPDSATFLDRRSPACMASAVTFLASPMLTDNFRDVAAIVRKGGTVATEEGTVAHEHPIWVEFARSMASMMAMPAELLARLVGSASGQPWRVLDVAAGHGMYGIAVARQNPQAQIVALDWASVLAVAQENAQAAGVVDRYQTLPGSAFEVDFGRDFDLVLLTNFLHHFDPATCETLLCKVHAALKPGGRAAALEVIPNEDRVTPPVSAAFSLMMLGSTPAGDAYTFSEYQRMFANAGFANCEFHRLPPTEQQVVIATK